MGRGWFALCVVVLGCSSVDADRAGEGRADGGAKAASGGASAPDASSGGTVNIWGASLDTGPPLICGPGVGVACPRPPPVGPFSEPPGYDACCLDDGSCGWIYTITTTPSFAFLAKVCRPFQEPGERDTACPEVSLTPNIISPKFAGCCRPDGTCGAIHHQTSGCVAVGTDVREYQPTCTP